MKVFRFSCLLILFLVVASVPVLVLVSASASASTTNDKDAQNHSSSHLRPRQLSPTGIYRPLLTYPPAIGTPRNCQASDFELPTALVDAWTTAGYPPFITTEIFGLIIAMQDGWTPGFVDTETPIVTRFVHLIDTMHWNCAAVYSATWLDGLTQEDPLVRSPPSFLDPVTSHEVTLHASAPRLLCMVHAWAAVVDDWLPEARTNLTNVLSAHQYQDVDYGFNAKVDKGFHAETGEADKTLLLALAAHNCYKPKIMGAIVAKQMTEYGRRDGYNMYGDLARDGTPCQHNCRRYTDFTNYQPNMNTNITARLRWQPMLEDDGQGYFTEQQFVTPHIGRTAKRAVLSTDEFTARVAQGITEEHETTIHHKAEARKVMELLRQTDDLKKAQIEFYNNKVAVTFAILGAVAAYGPSFEQMINFSFGLTASEYNSILVAWKEKVLHDRVRPTTWIQNMMANDEFDTYGGRKKGVKRIKGKEFESWSRVMPHSEYISGSACMCQSLKDYTDEWMTLTMGQLEGYRDAPVFQRGGSMVVPVATDDKREAPFIKHSSQKEPGVSPSTNLTLVVPTMSHLRTQCGQSRLDGGMHFQTAVDHAYPLCNGIGHIVADYSLNLLGSGGWTDTGFGFCECRFFVDTDDDCTFIDAVTGLMPNECARAAGCPADVDDGTYPDLTRKNSYCVCQQGSPATYTRCHTTNEISTTTDEMFYDSFGTISSNEYVTTFTDDGIPLGCNGYAGTTKTGVCVAKEDNVSRKGRNNKSYTQENPTCPKSRSYTTTTRSYTFPPTTPGLGKGNRFTHGLCVLHAASATVHSNNVLLSYQTLPNFGNGIELWGNGNWVTSEVNDGAAMCEGGIYFQPNKRNLSLSLINPLENTVITINVVPKDSVFPKSRGIEYTPYKYHRLKLTALEEFNTAFTSIPSIQTTDAYYAWCQLIACPGFNKESAGWCEADGAGACVNECQGQCHTPPPPLDIDPIICAFSPDVSNNGNWPTLLPDAGFSKSENPFTWSGTSDGLVSSDTHAYCKVLRRDIVVRRLNPQS